MKSVLIPWPSHVHLKKIYLFVCGLHHCASGLQAPVCSQVIFCYWMFGNLAASFSLSFVFLYLLRGRNKVNPEKKKKKKIAFNGSGYQQGIEKFQDLRKCKWVEMYSLFFGK